ncbi:tetratricopeptide repeat protein [Pedosphaera parvula]|uniref:Sel1 domain protein repeat-containing protein n=1 Tax=Pedosphaera parvula (strain Ellin514) TaxID=320771 RepID=B9XBQ2_PEDPL|nr:SEL1-like repeat protein [Pedosphaera parvula]EEF62937.1 Sel1 domain protein repeat-containing protein [Pedosphaera parvula Ellin514]
MAGKRLQTIICALCISVLLFASPCKSAWFLITAQSDEQLRLSLFTNGVWRAGAEPYRVVDGVTYDLHPLINYLGWAASPPVTPQRAQFLEATINDRPLRDWCLLFGIVQEGSGNDLVILQRYEMPDMQGDSQLVALKNFPGTRSLLAGTHIAAFARLEGTIAYSSSRSRSVMEVYDFGTPPNDAERALAMLESKNKIDASYQQYHQAILRQKAERERKSAAVKQRVIEFKKEAATNDFVYAQFDLGLLYLKGDGVKADKDLAGYWLNRAAAHGNSEAAQELEKHFSP